MFQIDYEFLKKAKESDLQPAQFLLIEQNGDVVFRLQEKGLVTYEERDGVFLVSITEAGCEALKDPENY